MDSTEHALSRELPGQKRFDFADQAITATSPAARVPYASLTPEQREIIGDVYRDSFILVRVDTPEMLACAELCRAGWLRYVPDETDRGWQVNEYVLASGVFGELVAMERRGGL